ncbi:MAG: trypsin-like peptidase domain-containing protein [Oscillospiraceae bacterium]|nr:trypsin-like peptidase domain-containing protein [Oscillospiraceae bacterium]
MKLFKKAITALAVLGLVGGAIPMSVSAVTYDPCDVNHDGSVDILDVTSINRYLSGQKTVLQYNQLDANQDLIVDATDADCVRAKIVKLSYTANFYSRKNNKDIAFPKIPSNITLNGVSDSTASRTYRRYSYNSKKELVPYSLKPNVESVNKSNSDVDVYTIGDTDERKQAKGLTENTGLVCLEIDRGLDANGERDIYKVTGFIVDDHVIATAAHCVYDTTNHCFYDNMKITTYAVNGKLTTKTLKAIEAHIPALYPVLQGQDGTSTEYDYALITVSDDLSEEKGYTHFKLGTAYNTTASYFSDTPIYITGRPDQIKTSGKWKDNTEDILYTDENKVTDTNQAVLPSKLVLFSNVDAGHGQSGSPMYTIIGSRTGNNNLDYTYVVLGIYSYGSFDYNAGSLITNYQLQFYNNNPNISY